MWLVALQYLFVTVALTLETSAVSMCLEPRKRVGGLDLTVVFYGV